MKGIDVARTVANEGTLYQVRLRPEGPPWEYDVRPGTRGKKKGWVYMDTLSASAIVAVYDALSPKNQEKYEQMDLLRMADVAFQVLEKQRARREGGVA